MFQHHNVHTFKKIIDEFILSSSSDNESIKYILRNMDFEAFILGIFLSNDIHINPKNVIQNRESQIR